MSSLVQAQWDIGASTFSLSDRLLSLVKAATVDDVQSLAVIAADAIGSCLDINPHLIGRAIDVLGASDSYRYENLKLAVGFAAGGVAREIRSSVSAAKTFILITALRTNLDNTGIADFLYELLIHSGLHNKIATSKTQLLGLCKALEGYCNKLDQVEDDQSQTWQNILPPLAAISREQFWHGIVPEEGAKLVVEAFQTLREEELDCIQLKGSHGAIWLAAMFWHLLPGRCDILDEHGKILVQGALHERARMTIQLDENCEEWTIQKFYKIRSIVDIIQITLDPTSEWVESARARQSPSIVPKRTICSLFRGVQPQKLAQQCSDAVGITAIAFVLLLLDSQLEKDHRYKIADICRPGFQYAVQQHILDLGWPEDSPIFDLAVTLASDINLHCRLTSIQRPSGHSRFSFLSNIVHQCMPKDSVFERGIGHYTLINQACIIVAYIMFQGVCSDPPGMVYQHSVPIQDETENILIDVLLHRAGHWEEADIGLHRQFINLMWHTFVPVHGSEASNTNTKNLLAISNRGYVARLACLEVVPTTPADACAILVDKGSLRWRDELCYTLYETSQMSVSTQPASSQRSISLTEKSTASALWNFPLPTSFQISLDKTLGRLYWHLKHTRCGDTQVTFAEAVDNFVLAWHVTPVSATPEQEIQLCRDAGIVEVLQGTWSPGFANTDKVIVSYSDDPIANFLRFGSVPPWIPCFIQGKASLRQCVLKAERVCKGGGWAILANP